MQITLALLADAANRADSGKLNLLGVFHTIYAAAVPCQHPSMALVINIKAGPMERGASAKLAVNLIDEDGKAILSLPESPIQIPEDPAVLTPDVNLIINLTGVTLPQYGSYSFDIALDGQSYGRVPLHLKQFNPQ
jgi:hypothetical protein